MLTLTGPRTWGPLFLPSLGRWLAALLGATRTGVAVTHAGDVTSTEYVWGYVIRREWADGRHDLFGFTADADKARRRLDRAERFWRGGPVRPVAVYVVAANASDVNQHPVDGCRSTLCPDSPERGQCR